MSEAPPLAPSSPLGKKNEVLVRLVSCSRTGSVCRSHLQHLREVEKGKLRRVLIHQLPKLTSD